MTILDRSLYIKSSEKYVHFVLFFLNSCFLNCGILIDSYNQKILHYKTVQVNCNEFYFLILKEVINNNNTIISEVIIIIIISE